MVFIFARRKRMYCSTLRFTSLNYSQSSACFFSKHSKLLQHRPQPLYSPEASLQQDFIHLTIYKIAIKLSARIVVIEQSSHMMSWLMTTQWSYVRLLTPESITAFHEGKRKGQIGHNPLQVLTSLVVFHLLLCKAQSYTGIIEARRIPMTISLRNQF